VWLTRLDFFVRFNDQHGGRNENVLRHRPRPEWASDEIGKA
jgi:hypothetical protein